MGDCSKNLIELLGVSIKIFKSNLAGLDEILLPGRFSVFNVGSAKDTLGIPVDITSSKSKDTPKISPCTKRLQVKLS